MLWRPTEWQGLPASEPLTLASSECTTPGLRSAWHCLLPKAGQGGIYFVGQGVSFFATSCGSQQKCVIIYKYFLWDRGFFYIHYKTINLVWHNPLLKTLFWNFWESNIKVGQAFLAITFLLEYQFASSRNMKVLLCHSVIYLKFISYRSTPSILRELLPCCPLWVYEL
jgi:hypothetical protein